MFELPTPRFFPELRQVASDVCGVPEEAQQQVVVAQESGFPEPRHGIGEAPARERSLTFVRNSDIRLDRMGVDVTYQAAAA